MSELSLLECAVCGVLMNKRRHEITREDRHSKTRDDPVLRMEGECPACESSRPKVKHHVEVML